MKKFMFKVFTAIVFIHCVISCSPKLNKKQNFGHTSKITECHQLALSPAKIISSKKFLKLQQNPDSFSTQVNTITYTQANIIITADKVSPQKNKRFIHHSEYRPRIIKHGPGYFINTLSLGSEPTKSTTPQTTPVFFAVALTALAAGCAIYALKNRIS